LGSCSTLWASGWRGSSPLKRSETWNKNLLGLVIRGRLHDLSGGVLPGLGVVAK
jgi:hypothetical protein